MISVLKIDFLVQPIPNFSLEKLLTKIAFSQSTDHENMFSTLKSNRINTMPNKTEATFHRRNPCIKTVNLDNS